MEPNSLLSTYLPGLAYYVVHGTPKTGIIPIKEHEQTR